MSEDLDAKLILSQLVAHRGYSARFPENTLLSIEQAFISGACYVECDVQLTADGVPVLMHDATLERTCGQTGSVGETSWEQLNNTSAHYAARFGDQHGEVPVPSLSQLLVLMKRWPRRQVFVEIKRASIRKFGAAQVFDAVIQVLGRDSDQLIGISFDFDILQRLRKETSLRTGWVIEQWTDENLELAAQLAPDYLFVDHECVPADLAALPEANWCWVIYEIDDAATAKAWVEKGADMIETNNIGGLLLAAEFAESRCND
jgi:glycerophosphoryl diester phosphodiesterase